MILKIGIVEKIDFRGELYPITCSQCGQTIGSGAEVYPAARVIFCGTDCAAEWFSNQLQAITSIREEDPDV